MALVVETGSGLTNADSYISLTDANSYVSDHGDPSSWSDATDDEKEEALRLGTQYIDLKYGNRFVGVRGSRDQALDWPRSAVVDVNGYIYDSDEIPTCLKYAVVEAALRHLAGDDLLGVLNNPGTIKSERKKIGVMEKEVEYVGGKAPAKAYPKIRALLRPILDSVDTISRG